MSDESAKYITAAGVAESVKRHVKEGAVREVVVLTHYGSVKLPVVEIWCANGALHLSVDHAALENNS